MVVHRRCVRLNAFDGSIEHGFESATSIVPKEDNVEALNDLFDEPWLFIALEREHFEDVQFYGEIDLTIVRTTGEIDVGKDPFFDEINFSSEDLEEIEQRSMVIIDDDRLDSVCSVMRDSRAIGRS